MTEVRLAELVAALSLGVDLGFGQPMEHVLRESMIALRLADRIGLEDAERSTVYYTGLLVNVGCHADAHEQAKWFGDDIALKSGKYDHDFRSLRATVAMLSLVGSGNPPLHRFRVGLEFAISGRHDLDGMVAGHAAVATALAERLGLPEAVQEAVGASYEQWDGKGWPQGRAGDAIPVASRLAQFAEFVEVAHRLGGNAAALELAEERAGLQFDPALSAALRADPEGILGGLDSAHTWSAVIDAEPALRVTLGGDDFDRALRAIADFVDLKSPYTLGHARAVGTSRSRRRRSSSCRRTRRVSSGAPRSSTTWGAGRLERDLGQTRPTRRRRVGAGAPPPLSDRAHAPPVGGARPARGDRRPAPRAAGRLRLSEGPIRWCDHQAGPDPRAVDAYRSMREPRPHRPALSAQHAAEELRADARAGKLDAEAVAAVLAAAGHPAGRRHEWPGGLTSREVDVLRLVARGLSSKQIATELVITTKTARNHIEHIYTKIDASSRVAASLYATEHGLL